MRQVDQQLKEGFLLQARRLEDYSDVGPVSSYFEEILGDDSLLGSIEAAVLSVDFFRTKHWNSALELGLYRMTMYALARAIKPSMFVETGILHGLTSNFILAALKKNGQGVLVSADLPSYFQDGPSNKDGHFDTLPPGKEPGWIVGDEYRKYWKIEIGASLSVLPSSLPANETIDVFLHDSEHTYETMFGEFEFAWEKLRKGGFLVADNIIDNTSFFDFCRQVNRHPQVFPELNPSVPPAIRFGLVVK